jgi:hypothetical protein
LNLYLQVFDGNQIDAVRFGAIDRKEVDLSLVTPSRCLRIAMVPVATACSEENRSLAKPARLALNPCQPSAIIDNKVIASVLAERQQGYVPGIAQRNHDG